MRYSLYNSLLDLKMYPNYKFEQLLEEIKNFPYYSQTDKHIILFLLVSGNNFKSLDKDKLTEFILQTFPDFISVVERYDDVSQLIDSFNPDVLNTAVRGLLLIISQTCDFTLDFELDEYEQIIYVGEKQLEQINQYWDKECFSELGMNFQILPMSS